MAAAAVTEEEPKSAVQLLKAKLDVIFAEATHEAERKLSSLVDVDSSIPVIER